MKNQNITIEVCQRSMDYCYGPKTDSNGEFVYSHGKVVTERKPKYHAQLFIGDEKSTWGCGKSYDEALGSLVRNAAVTLGIKLSLLGKLAR